MTKITKPKSWRDVLPINPACEMLPPVSADGLRGLGADIKKNGLKTRIVLWSPGKEIVDKGAPVYLLDGRNRLDAMESLGVRFVGADGKFDPDNAAQSHHHYEQKAFM